VDDLSNWEIWLQNIGIVGLAWAFACLFLAIRKVVNDDRARAVWHGNRRVYLQPLLIDTLRCRPTGEWERYQLKFSDAEPGSFVYCRIQLDRVPPNARMDIGGAVFFEKGFPAQRTWSPGILLPKDRIAIFSILLPPESVSVTVRIYCENFIVGEHNDQDGNAGNWQFPLRPPPRRDAKGRPA